VSLSGLIEMSRLGMRMLGRGYVSVRKAVNFARCGIHAYAGNLVPAGYPPVCAIDPCASCNLRCMSEEPYLVCPAGNAPPTPLKCMDFGNYTRLVDEVADYTLALFLYVVGEPFMNPDLCEMIEYAHRKRVYTVVSTNGHFISSAAKAERLVRSRLDDLIVTISGITQDTYSQYHRGGQIEIVLRSIANVLSARRTLRARNPRVIVRYLEFAHNIGEKNAARARLKEIGVDAFSSRRARTQFQTENIPMVGSDAIPDCQRRVVNPQPRQKSGRRRCLWPWFIGVVNWDGAVAPCTQYPWVSEGETCCHLGSVFAEGSFKQVWQGEKLQEFRRCLLSKEDLPEVCRDCIRTLGYGDKT
jgi:MoaA/NifB/PqqE/SkfB family radical SAM enzyme